MPSVASLRWLAQQPTPEHPTPGHIGCVTLCDVVFATAFVLSVGARVEAAAADLVCSNGGVASRAEEESRTPRLLGEHHIAVTST